MSAPQAIVAHLLEGREELVREVQRLTNAIAELDALIGRLGGSGATAGLAVPASTPDVGAATSPRVQVESRAAGAAGSRTPARRAPAKSGDQPGGVARATRSAATNVAPVRTGSGRTTGGRATRSTDAGRTDSAGEGQKSIRVHVLEMLSAENRDFGLAEIIDRIHGAGIDAHDDAVRSITIKLMKDGRVERVGRGQYRLTRRRSRSPRSSSGGSSAGKEDASPADFEASLLPEASPAGSAASLPTEAALADTEASLLPEASPGSSSAAPTVADGPDPDGGDEVDAARPGVMGGAGDATRADAAADNRPVIDEQRPADGAAAAAVQHRAGDGVSNAAEAGPASDGTPVRATDGAPSGGIDRKSPPADAASRSEDHATATAYTPPLNLAEPWLTR